MRKLLILFLIALNVSVYAQTQEPEISYSGSGKIVTNDGKELQGEISFSFVSSRKIAFKPVDGEEQKILVKDVKEFYISDMHFVKVLSTALTLAGSNEEIAIIKTPENYKIKIYETINQGIIGSGSPATYETNRDYVVLFPNAEKPRSISDLSFAPLNKKVSKLIADCPSLSEKIASKADGYKLGMISSDQQRLDMFLKIANEYQECK